MKKKLCGWKSRNSFSKYLLKKCFLIFCFEIKFEIKVLKFMKNTSQKKN